MPHSTSELGILIGIDIGGTNLRVALADAKGKILRKHRSLVNESLGESRIDTLCRSIERLLEEYPQGTLLGIGAAFPGPIDRASGEVVHSPHLEREHRIPVKATLEECFGVTVVLDNDANAAALGEHRCGAGVGVSDMIYLTISTGIGGGFILGDKLYRGFLGGAGEAGHILLLPEGPLCACGRRGCLEAVSSGTAIAREATASLEKGRDSLLTELSNSSVESIDAKMVYKAALQGDVLCQEIISNAAYYLGLGLASLINIFNPELVVLGGGVINMGDMILEPATKLARERAMPLASGAVRFKPGCLGDDAGLVGALLLIQEELSLVSVGG